MKNQILLHSYNPYGYITDTHVLFYFYRTVSVDDLNRALSLADPEIDNKTMDKYVLWVFDTTSDKVAEVESLELSKVISRLQNGNVRRSGRVF